MARTQGAALDKRLVATENAVTKLNSDLNSIFILKDGVTDILQYSFNYNGLFSTAPNTANLPAPTYGIAFSCRNIENKWILVIWIPTHLTCIYLNFYNGYGTSGEWSGWKQIQ